MAHWCDDGSPKYHIMRRKPCTKTANYVLLCMEIQLGNMQIIALKPMHTHSNTTVMDPLSYVTLKCKPVGHVLKK